MTAAVLSFAWAVLVLIDLGEFYRGATWCTVWPRHIARQVAVAAFPAICVYAAHHLP